MSILTKDLAYDPDGTDNLEWISLSHMADSKSGNDTFISVYGHAIQLNIRNARFRLTRRSSYLR